MTEIDHWGHPVERVSPQRPAPTPPMTRAETRAVLAVVCAYDNREPTEAVVAAWFAAAQDARWTHGEAVTAVRQHYATSAEWVMPAHVTERIRAARQDRAMRAEAEQARAVNPATATRVRDLCAEYGLTHFSISDDTREHPRGLHVPCDGDKDGPGCRAPRGEGCTHSTRGKVPGFVHPSRIEAERAYIASHRQ